MFEICFTDVFCSALGLTPHPGLLKAMTPEDDPSAPILEVYVDSELGSAGLRAFAAALLVSLREAVLVVIMQPY
jgi:hypothetical protein